MIKKPQNHAQMTKTARGTKFAKRAKARIYVTAGRDITLRANDVSVSRLKISLLY